MRYVATLLAAAGVLVTGATAAKCASVSTSERFSEAETVALVSIIDARDGLVPWPYGIFKGAVPGRLLTLRVVRSWKGPLHPDDILYGWTPSPRVEDAYPDTEAGTQIIVFYDEAFPRDIMSCNAAGPHHQDMVSKELDALVSGKTRDVDPNNRWTGP